MKIRVIGNWEYRKGALGDTATDGCLLLLPSLAEAREAFQFSERIGGGFLGAANPFAIAVPSVIVPAWNVVLYPNGIGFWDHISLETIEPFNFDPRLFPENTPLEEPQEETQG